jgi:hypothetical protein
LAKQGRHNASLKLAAREQEHVQSFDLSTPDGLSKLTNDLIKETLNGKLEPRITGAVNGVVANFIRYSRRIEPTPEAHTIDEDAIIARFILRMPAGLAKDVGAWLEAGKKADGR